MKRKPDHRSEGSIDILINNAVFGSYGALEDVPLEDARYQLEVNVFGAARLMQPVLPIMRKKRWARSSISPCVGLYFITNSLGKGSLSLPSAIYLCNRQTFYRAGLR